MKAPMQTSPLAWLDEVEQRRRDAGLRRSLRPRPAVATELDLASNDYLGLSQHPDVIEGGVAALRMWGAGATGSRLVTGDTELHQEFESELAEYVGAASGLLFSSGYTANLGAVVGLSGPGSLVVSDAYSHASLVDACRLSRARVVVAPHRDVAAVDAALGSRAEERAVVITDSVFSADGTLAPLRDLHDSCRRHRALLIVDEAHGLGVRGGGRGLLHEVGLAGSPDVVMTTTLSKALGSQGGAVLGPAAVRAHLIDAARPFIFDTGLAPAAVGAALAALRVMRAEAWRPEAVLRHAAELASVCGAALGDDAGRRAARGGAGQEVGAALGDDAGRRAARGGAGQEVGAALGDDAGRRAARGGAGQGAGAVPTSAVVSVILGDPEVALAAATACLDAGVRVGCFRPPTVPAGTSRLRLTARASLDAAELDLARRVLTEVLAGARR
jgi:8-amino-7-oxononanoate synthase